ncbi:MAG: phenylalanine--tRNA ligase subunit beta [Planctomycetota bacterium]|jgi:phenylalanyl-tRNA synthetase beta chain
MYASVKWMNDYLDPPADAEEQAELLTQAGFPLERREELSGSDVQQDFEMASNRGDCLCHVGLAREIAAISGRNLKPPRPSLTAGGPPARELVTVTNREPDRCPLYTARIIRGVRVGPSPDWLAGRLRAINQIPRNNIVDASNFVLFELGQPTHVFDLAKLAGPQIIIRMAQPGEQFLPIGEGARKIGLTGQDLVIADAETAVAIAGVKGGAETAVTPTTTDLLLEAATFDPVAVRNTSRRLLIESDASFRFERGVHPGQVNAAAERLAELILDLAGGQLADGVVSDGAPIPPPREVTMRPGRCCELLGVQIGPEQMMHWLDRLGFGPSLEGDVIRCVVPIHRLDVEREVDLIEEVGRILGHDNLPVGETIQIRVAPLQSTELARRAVSEALVGLGFVETVTHSLIGEPVAEAFLPPGAQLVRVDDEGSRAEGVLRPSILPSLLRVAAHNRANGVKQLRFFESAATFDRDGESHREQERLALVADLPVIDEGLRSMRGVVERLVEVLLGSNVVPQIVPDESSAWLAPGAVVKLDDRAIGRLGVIAPHIRRLCQLDEPIAAAELDLPDLYDRYPPETEAHALPSFPAVERDVSAIVDEQTRWVQLRGIIDALDLDHLEAVEFVSTFRGRQIGPGRKSVTMRLRFRAADRTLVHESVNTQVEAVMTALRSELKAHIREQSA